MSLGLTVGSLLAPLWLEITVMKKLRKFLLVLWGEATRSLGRNKMRELRGQILELWQRFFQTPETLLQAERGQSSRAAKILEVLHNALLGSPPASIQAVPFLMEFSGWPGC
jgi:hypothetical protein